MRLRATLLLVCFVGCAEGETLGSHPGPREDAAYVADSACVSCHPAEAEAWTGSHHDLAMQPATEATVLGDFDEATFGSGEDATRFFRRGDRFLLQTKGRDGKRALFEVPYVFGVAPLQQLLVTLPGGRLQAFPIAWDSRGAAEGGQRWFHLTPDDPPAPGDPFHWTGVYQTWNHQCASCHSTAVRRGFDPALDAYTTTWAEIDVGCQACHGGGAEHVAWSNGPGERPEMASVSRESQLDACGPCHSRRSEITPDAIPGGLLLDAYLPAAPVPPLYHADGQIRDEVYVLGSFLQSRMHAAGVVCSDCHDPHRAEPIREGNALCVGCHGGSPPDRFAAQLPGATDYDTPAHHHHHRGSEASRCVSCHMPSQIYMGVDARRDHSFRIPRPALAAGIGAPDACTACHTDRDPSWAAEAIEGWRGEGGASRPDLTTALASDDGEKLALLALDTSVPSIVRAAAIDRLAGAQSLPPAFVAAAAADADPLLRAYAVRATRSLEPRARADLAATHLDDPVRAVRLEAARALAETPAELLGERAALRDTGLDELAALLRANADTPAAHLQLGELAERRGHDDPDRHYREALRLDPGLEPAAHHLARRQAGRGRLEAAERTLRRALELNPAPTLRYDLGLLLAQSGRIEEAASELELAARELRGDPRVFYNLGLLWEQLRRYEAAEAAYLTGLRAAPDHPDLLYALVAFYGNRGRPQQALPFADRLAAIRGDEESRALQKRLRDAAGR